MTDEQNPEITSYPHYGELTKSDALTSTQPLHQLPMSLGRFTLMKRLGVGGMAEVFLAQTDGSDDLPSTVVVKRMLPHISQSPRSVEMFEREAQIALRFDHPHLVRTFELGEHPTGKYMVLEFVDGMNVRTLADELRKKDETLPLDVIAQILSDAARGLHHFHETPDSEGNVGAFVHRDISPDNLMISRDGVTKILDFGVARPGQDMKMTTTGEVKGKVAYMPPEQIESETLDGRADLYALGASAFWLLSGARPYDRPQEHLTILAALTDPVPSLLERVPSCPPDFDKIVMKLLAKRRDDRYENGVELYQALQPFLQHDTRERASKITRSVHAELQANRERELSAVDPSTATPVTRNSRPQPVVSMPPLEQEFSSSHPVQAASKAPIWGASALIAGALVFVGLQLRPASNDDEIKPDDQVVPAAASIPTADSVSAQGPGPNIAPTPAAPSPHPNVPAPPDPGAPTPESNPLAKPDVSETSPTPLTVDAPSEETSTDAPNAKSSAAKIKSRVKGPKSVRWYTTQGKKLGAGEQDVVLEVKTRVLIAKDDETGGVHQVNVRDGVADFNQLKEGMLEIRVLPYADVYLGARKVGRTPQKLTLREGKYTVRLVYEGTESTKSIRIKANRTERIKERMK